MQRGKFITLEGGEGAGKSTQARLLAERLDARGIAALVTREPGGSGTAEKIRELVLSARPASPHTETLLFAAARTENLAVAIRPALTSGRWVICDRFIDSTRVYQGVLGGVPRDLIAALERHTVAPDYPDLTVILDIDPAAGMARASARGALSRYDAEGMETHRTLRRGFLDIAKAEPNRCVVIDGGRDIEAVAADIWAAVAARLPVKA